MASEDDAILASIAAATTRLRARAEARQSRDAAQVEALEARASRVARRCPPAGGRGEAGADAAEGEACDALAALERQTAAAVDRCALQRAKYAEKPRFDGMRQDAWTARLRRRDELARLAVLARETPATAARRRAESEVREARWRREAAWGFVTAAAEKRSASVEALRRGYPWWTSPLQGAGLQLAGAKISRGDADDLDEWRCTAAERTALYAHDRKEARDGFIALATATLAEEQLVRRRGAELRRQRAVDTLAAALPGVRTRWRRALLRLARQRHRPAESPRAPSSHGRAGAPREGRACPTEAAEPYEAARADDVARSLRDVSVEADAAHSIHAAVAEAVAAAVADAAARSAAVETLRRATQRNVSKRRALTEARAAAATKLQTHVRRHQAKPAPTPAEVAASPRTTADEEGAETKGLDDGPPHAPHEQPGSADGHAVEEDPRAAAPKEARREQPAPHKRSEEEKKKSCVCAVS